MAPLQQHPLLQTSLTCLCLPFLLHLSFAFCFIGDTGLMWVMIGCVTIHKLQISAFRCCVLKYVSCHLLPHMHCLTVWPNCWAEAQTTNALYHPCWACRNQQEERHCLLGCWIRDLVGFQREFIFSHETTIKKEWWRVFHQYSHFLARKSGPFSRVLAQPSLPQPLGEMPWPPSSSNSRFA